MDQLLGFTPDSETTVAGILTDCTNLIPYEGGMKGAPVGVSSDSIPVLAAKCLGAAVITKLDDTRRIFAGTATKLYEYNASAWVDVSGAVYTSGVDTRWTFAQFGDATLAANLSDTIQRSNGSGAFASIAGAPKAKIIYSVGAFIMALNTDDGTYGVSTDRWWCSASFNDSDWTPNVSTLCTTGRIVATPGRITAGGKLGDYAIAYKEKSAFIGQFVGAPAVWDFAQVPGGDFGCVGINAWCDIGGAHFTVGKDNIWLFDGSRPVSIANGQVRKWFFANSNPYFLAKTQCVFDENNHTVWMFYASSTSTVLDQALVYNLDTKQWGKSTQTIETTVNYINSGLTIDQMGYVSATIDELALLASFDSTYWLVGQRNIACFSDSHQIQFFTGPTVSSAMTTGDTGDDNVVSLLLGIRLRFASGYKPDTATATTYTKMTSGDDLTTASSGSLDDGKFDVIQSARWHRAAFAFTGDVRVTGLSANVQPEGDR